MKCELCGAPVTVEGNTTHYYVNEYDKLKAREKKLIVSLRTILIEANMAAQGNWDATDKIKDIAYGTLAELEAEGEKK